MKVIDSPVPPTTAVISKMAQADDVCKTEVQGVHRGQRLIAS